MKCPRCHQETPSDTAFCPKCGAKLSVACPQCGAANAPDDNFCRKCGHRLATAVTPSSPTFGSPEFYTPKHLAEKILTSKSALEGERKQVTVLFADLKGSMELLADRDPEAARKILDPVLERMMEAVHHYEGTVNQVMGDGIMALFGAPVAHEDHAVRGCYAALQMQESVKRYDDELQRTHGVAVQIRVGLNSGEVVVRSIRSDLHMDYTAVGQTTHLAARMEQMAKPGSVLATADTLRLAEGYVEVRPLGPVGVKGMPQPVEVYELAGAGPVRTRLQALLRRPLSRFVGRDAEVEQLRRALDKAREGHGQIAAIVGEPGVGKSRLVYEFTHSHRTYNWLILEACSVSYGKATSYLPVIDLFKTYFKIQDADGHRAIREKVIGKLLALDRALEPVLPAFLSLLDVPAEDDLWERLDPPQRRQQTLDAVRRLLIRESQAQPLLLLFEDLHWIDSETQAVLNSLAESLPTSRILMLVSYRPEYQHGWVGRSYYRQLQLDPLPPESAEELLHALLGGDVGLDALRRLLIKHTEGNPFFLEESVRTLIEARALVGERGAYRLAKALKGIQMPATVQAVLAARIDRLPPEEKQLLQTAAVIGHEVPFVLLEAIAGEDEEHLRRGLAHLQGAEFLYETSLFPHLEYTFKHALTHEVTYGSLLQGRRRALHARIVDVIERRYQDDLGDHVERLAHHAIRAEAWEKSVAYSGQAGAKAVARSAHREAVTWFEQAMTALRRLPDRRELIERAIDLRFELRTALLPLGEFGRMFEILQEAEALAQALEDQGRLGRVWTYMTDYFRQTGEYRRGAEVGQRSLAVAESLCDLSLLVAADIYLGHVCFDLGEYRRAAELFRRNVEALHGELRRERLGLPYVPAVHSRAWLVFCLAELGGFGEAARWGEEALEIAESVEHPLSLISACATLGRAWQRKGDTRRAIPLLERGLEMSRAWHIRLWAPALGESLGMAQLLAGRISEALPVLQQALDNHRALRGTAALSSRITGLGYGCLLAGRLEEARGLAERALELARNHEEGGNQAYAHWLAGEVVSHGDTLAFDSADESYREAINLAEALEMRPLLGRCHLGLSRLCRRAGRRAEADAFRAGAIDLFRQLDMTLWLEQAESETNCLH